MLMVGVLMYALFYYQGHYFVEGVGYATIQAILENNLAGFALLLGLFAAKLFATKVSLGSGASGGIFSPSLFMGATLGAAFGGFVTMSARCTASIRSPAPSSAWRPWSAAAPARP